MSLEDILFQTGDRDEKTILFRLEIYMQLMAMVREKSLKTAYFMYLFGEILSVHYYKKQGTFKDHALALKTSPEVLRRYAKQLAADNYISYKKLTGCTYEFSVGSKFEHWLWESNLFKKKHKEDVVDKGYVYVDNLTIAKDQTVHYGLSNSEKQSTTDSQTVHHGPPINSQKVEIIEKLQKTGLLSSSSSSLYLSSENKKFQLSGNRGPSEREMQMEMDRLWKEENAISGISFKEWSESRI